MCKKRIWRHKFLHINSNRFSIVWRRKNAENRRKRHEISKLFKIWYKTEFSYVLRFNCSKQPSIWHLIWLHFNESIFINSFWGFLKFILLMRLLICYVYKFFFIFINSTFHMVTDVFFFYFAIKLFLSTLQLIAQNNNDNKKKWYKKNTNKKYKKNKLVQTELIVVCSGCMVEYIDARVVS